MKKLLILLCTVTLLLNNTVLANAQIIHNSASTDLTQTVTTAQAANEDIIDITNREPSTSIWPKDAPNLNSEAAIVMEASTGAILYAKNIHKTFYPASITKILTALIAIQNSSLGDTITFSKNAIYDVELDSSRIGIDVGEQLTMEQSLYGLMLASANEVAYAIAEHVSGDVDTFAKLMNTTAANLGCVDSNFVNPHGLPDPNHYTSAYDMGLISRAAINNSTFREITGTSTYAISPTNIQEETRYLTNHHKFIKYPNTYEGCIGGKTGYTSKAKYTLVTYAKRNGMTLISVILHCDSIENEYADTSSLLNYAFDNYTLYNISEMEEPLSNDTAPLFTKYSPLFSNTSSNLKVSPSGNIILPNTAKYKEAKKKITLSPINTVNEGENVIGSITYSYDGIYCGYANIIYDKAVTSSMLKGSFVPTPTTTPNVVSSDVKTQSKIFKPIIGIILGIIIIGLLLYIIFIEIPYRKRRRAYHFKRRRRR